jgi:NADPH2:quinone reductase
MIWVVPIWFAVAISGERMGATMRAAYYDRNGPAADVLTVGDVEMPKPGGGEVRVKLTTSGVNPSDVKSRGGSRKVMAPYVIPHSDGAGVIDVVGDGVPPGRIGERVWVWNGQWKRPFGTAAEYIVVPQAMAVPLPDKIGFEAGACLGIPAMTAIHAVDLAGADEGTTLLIPGGAGGVGHYAIQFAKARKANVITTVSSPSKAKLARGAGADHVIDYKAENVGERVMAITGNRGADAVIELDLAANAKHIPHVLRPKGTVVIYGTGAAEATIPAQFCLINGIRLQFMLVYELTQEERERAVGGIMRLLEDNRLINNVALTLPLADIVAAHEAVEQGKTAGNVVVTLR